MSSPLPPNVPQLMLCLSLLTRESWAGQLPDVTAGQAFWAAARDVPSLIASGLAELAPAGTTAPPAEPRWTARGTPGFGAGTSNCSY